jgi:drug/metabolite transporter (DMT)-like permease
MSRSRVFVLTLLAMLAFAGNSLLCRAALKGTAIDAATFTTIRIASGAITLWLIARMRAGEWALQGSWLSAFWLFAYAAAFSFAYVTLTAAAGALLLFGAVQATMIVAGFAKGERFARVQWIGFVMAVGGLAALMLPGASAPPPVGAALMLGAGVAWGFYSLRGRGAGDATRVTAGNFVRAVPFAALVSVAAAHQASFDVAGIALAIASGAIASGVGYAIWYTALPSLKATVAATVQLSVPAIAAFGGVVLLGEPLGLRLVVCSAAILGGIALVVRRR